MYPATIVPDNCQTNPDLGGNISVMNSSTTDCPTNAYWNRDVLSDLQNTIFVSSLGIMAPIIFGTNALLAYALRKTKQLNSSFSVLVFLLCISDCFTATVVIPLDIIMFTLFRYKQNCTFEFALIFLQQFAAHISVYSIVTLALLRYSQLNPNMIKPTGWKKRVTSRTGTIFLIAITFIMAVFHGLVSSYMFGYYYNRVPNWIIKALDAASLIIILSLYFRLFCRIKVYTETNRVVEMSSKSPDLPRNVQALNQTPKYFTRLTIIVFLTVAATVIFAMPFIIVDAIVAYYEDFTADSTVPQLLRFFYFYSWVILALNPTFNALLFSLSNTRVKTFYKKKIFQFRRTIINDCRFCKKNAVQQLPSNVNFKKVESDSTS